MVSSYKSVNKVRSCLFILLFISFYIHFYLTSYHNQSPFYYSTWEHKSKRECLYKCLISVDCVLNDLLTVRRKSFFRFLVQLIRIDWFPVFDDDMCFSNAWKLFFKNGNRIIHADRNDRASGFFCNFEGTGVERKKA